MTFPFPISPLFSREDLSQEKAKPSKQTWFHKGAMLILCPRLPFSFPLTHDLKLMVLGYFSKNTSILISSD